MSKRRAEVDSETDELASQFKFATIEAKEDGDFAHESPKRKGDNEVPCPSSPLGIWNKLRWVAPSVWEQVTNRAQTPHPLLLRVYISKQFHVNASNSIHTNLTLLLACITKML